MQPVLLPDENDKIERFLDNHPDFKLIPVAECASLLPNLPDTGEYLLLTSARHKTDGFLPPLCNGPNKRSCDDFADALSLLKEGESLSIQETQDIFDAIFQGEIEEADLRLCF